MKFIPGRHICKKIMEFRVSEVLDDNRIPFAWIVYGICRMCNQIILLELFLQETEPIPNADFKIEVGKYLLQENIKKGNELLKKFDAVKVS